MFHGYYEPTPEEFEKIWSAGLLVPDTNVLLHLFRFMPARRAEVLAAFESFGNRLWLPYQVAAEFQADWREADSGNRAAYEKLKDDLAKKRQDLEAAIGAFSRFDPWPKGSSMEDIGKFFDRLIAEVDRAVTQLPEALTVFNEVTVIFDGKVGDQPNDIELRRKEAQRRYEEKIPPGYKDKGRAGDYLIWAEMRDKAKVSQLPMLFVTDDSKEDWWARHSGRTLGPRPELRHEFFNDTGQLFYAYSPARFLSFVSTRDRNLVSIETVQEMERVQDAQSSEIPPASGRRNAMFYIATRLSTIAHIDPEEIISLAKNIAKVNSEVRTEFNLRKHDRAELTDREFDDLEQQLDILSEDADWRTIGRFIYSANSRNYDQISNCIQPTPSNALHGPELINVFYRRALSRCSTSLLRSMHFCSPVQWANKWSFCRTCARSRPARHTGPWGPGMLFHIRRRLPGGAGTRPFAGPTSTQAECHAGNQLYEHTPRSTLRSPCH
nr:PIN-like domain-containing protein [Mesorhizobium sp.]